MLQTYNVLLFYTLHAFSSSHRFHDTNTRFVFLHEIV